jgi:hypothetical protein
MRGTGRYYVTVTIAGVDHDLGSFATASESGALVAKWLRDRGLVLAPGSANRLSEAQRLDAAVVIFDVERGITPPAAIP